MLLFYRFFKISDTINSFNIDEYLKLNDSIYLQILNSNDQSLNESKQIINNIETRNLYKFIARTILTKAENIELIKQSVSDL